MANLCDSAIAISKHDLETNPVLKHAVIRTEKPVEGYESVDEYKTKGGDIYRRVHALEGGYAYTKNNEPTTVEDLQNRIYKNRITTLDDLKLEISCAEYEGELIDEFDDVLHPMGYNTCDRCEGLQDSEVGLLWLDGFDWEDDNPEDQAILKALAEEKHDYCAICYDCLNELKEKGAR